MDGRLRRMAVTHSHVEDEIENLLAATRVEAECYASASYMGPQGEQRSGLGLRLQAIEEALLRLARAIDNAKR